MGKAQTRAKDPTAYKVMFADGPDSLYVTPPEWYDAAKALNSVSQRVSRCSLEWR
jgi:hypothetical protein